MTKVHEPESKHPENYQRDLNPDASAGQNYGLIGVTDPARTGQGNAG